MADANKTGAGRASRGQGRDFEVDHGLGVATEPVGVFAEGAAVGVGGGILVAVGLEPEDFAVVDAAGGAGLVRAASVARRHGAEVFRLSAGDLVQVEGVGTLHGVLMEALSGQGYEGFGVGVVSSAVLPVEVEALPFFVAVALGGHSEEEQHDDAERVNVETGGRELVRGLVFVGADFFSYLRGAVHVAERLVDTFELPDFFVGDFVA